MLNWDYSKSWKVNHECPLREGVVTRYYLRVPQVDHRLTRELL